MKTLRKSTFCALVAASVALLGCPSDDTGGDGDEDDTGTDTDTNTNTNTVTDSVTNTVTDSVTDTVTATTSDSMTDTAPDTSAEGPDTSAGSSSTTTDPNEFQFNPTDPAEYVRVDRMGFPAVNTGLHIHGDKDEYNANDPESDLGAYFDMSAMEAIESLLLLHFGPDEVDPALPSGLDEELEGFGLATCNPFPLGQGTCVNQGGGAAVYPDTIKINLSLTAGFHLDEDTCAPVPNGRQLSSPVIDVVLAVLLLDLSQPLPEGFGLLPCPNDPDAFAPATAFLAIPDGDGGTFSLNPIANDLPFETEFPYVAAAHAP